MFLRKPDIERRAIGAGLAGKTGGLDFMVVQPRPNFAHGCGECPAAHFYADNKGRICCHRARSFLPSGAGAQTSLRRRHGPGAKDADISLYLMSGFVPKENILGGFPLAEKAVVIPVALAGYRGQTGVIEDTDHASGVADQPHSLKLSCGFRDPRAVGTEHCR